MSRQADARSLERLRSAFTLLELLVVLAIIALLASFVAPTVFRNVSDARHATARAQIDALSVALHAYQLDLGAYPSTAEGLDALRERPVSAAGRLGWRGPYLAKELVPDPWRRAYVYVGPGLRNPASFDLYSLGRDGRPGGEGEDADITSWGGTLR